MRQLYIAAYRAYWTNNRFAFPIGPATYDRWLDIVGSHPSKRAKQELAQLNRFGTPPPVTGIFRMLPSTRDTRHIRHFTASWHDSDIFDVIFEQGKWHARALSPHDKPPGSCDAGYYGWRRAQGQVEKEVQAVLLASARYMRKDALLDPRTGEGLHGGVSLQWCVMKTGTTSFCGSGWASLGGSCAIDSESERRTIVPVPLVQVEVV